MQTLLLPYEGREDVSDRPRLRKSIGNREDVSDRTRLGKVQEDVSQKLKGVWQLSLMLKKKKEFEKLICNKESLSNYLLKEQAKRSDHELLTS